MKKYKATYIVPNGKYKSNSLIGLVAEVLKHRFFHLLNHKKWMD